MKTKSGKIIDGKIMGEFLLMVCLFQMKSNSTMPINVATEIQAFNQEQFHALDKKLMRIVFDVHNEFGRFLDESLYKSEIATRSIAAGLGSAEREVQISVTHETFRKEYAMDLLFNHGVMLEAKVAEALAGAHRTQGLNYLFLTGMQHGRLANFRPERVEHEFLSTHLTGRFAKSPSANTRYRLCVHRHHGKTCRNARSPDPISDTHSSPVYPVGQFQSQSSRIQNVGKMTSPPVSLLHRLFFMIFPLMILPVPGHDFSDAAL